jgi:hypothetical protein
MKHKNLLILAAFLIPFLFLALPILPADQILHCGDGELGNIAINQRLFKTAGGTWLNNYLLGNPTFPSQWLSSFFIALFSPKYAEGVIYLFFAFLAATGTFLFLRTKGLSRPAAFLGGLALGLNGHFLTLLNAGHLGKFELMAGFAFTLFSLEKAIQTRRAIWFALCGAFFACGFGAQPDIGLLIAIIPASYLLFHLIQAPTPKIRIALLLKIPISACCFALVVLPAFSGAINNFIKTDKQPAQPKTEIKAADPAETWDWATSWSLSPEELFEFICPGFFGINSGHQTAPYWGRVGPANAPRTQNFRQNGEYLGLIPFAFFIVTLILLAQKNTFDKKTRGELFLWLGLMLTALILSLGRFTPFYRLFYSLPHMDQIRCPVKFIHLLSFAFCVLSAYGFDYVLKNKPARAAKIALYAMAGIAAAGLISALLVSINKSGITEFFNAQNFPADMAQKMHGQMLSSLLRMSLLAALTAGFFFVCVKKEFFTKHQTKWVIALLVVFAIDLVGISQKYINPSPYNQLYHQTNVDSFLIKNRLNGRSKFLARQGIYNHWMTYHITYFDLQSIDIPALREMPADYASFFGALQGKPIRMFELTSTRYFIGPTQIWQQLQSLSPAGCKTIQPFNIAQLGDKSIETLWSPIGSQTLGELTTALPRCGLYTHWLATDEKATLQKLGAPDFDPQKTVLVPETCALQPSTGPAPVQKVNITRYSLNRIEIELPDLSQSGIVVFTDRFDPKWKAEIDGVPAELLRCNHIMRGVSVQPGDKKIVMSYTPYRIPFLLSMGSLLVILAWSLVSMIRRLRTQKQTPGTPP